MTDDGAVSDLGCGPEDQTSMLLLNHLIGFVFTCIGTSSQPDKLTTTLQASQIVVVVAVV